MKDLNNELSEFLTKILIPSIAGISLKIAIQMKRMKVSFLSVVLSFITGIVVAWFCSDAIHNNVPDDYQAVSIAIIAISGEKIGDFFVNKFRVDDFLGAIINAVRDVIIKMISK
jgi:steroid 5-alpha reductase family enzyme